MLFFLAMFSCYWLRLYVWGCICIMMGYGCLWLILVTQCKFHQKLIHWYMSNPPMVFIHVDWGFQWYHKFPACISFLNDSSWVKLLILENITSYVSVHTHIHKYAHTWNSLLLRSVLIIYCIRIRLTMSLNKLSSTPSFVWLKSKPKPPNIMHSWVKWNNFLIKVWWITEKGSASVIKEM